MFSSILEVTRRAQAGGYAIPAFNVVDGNTLRAVVDAAADSRSPVVIQLSVKTVRQWGLSNITETARLATEKVDVPVVLHLDHCPDIQLCKDVIDAGWSSVLMDVSTFENDTDVQPTLNEICSYAHQRRSHVEIEVENILGVEDGVGSDEVLRSCTVDELIAIGEEAGADLLAPQLGTAHGVYRSEPKLLPERAAEFKQKTRMSIVLHGGTGLKDQDFRAFIEAGVSKINISTDLKTAFIQAANDLVGADGKLECTEPLDLISRQYQRVKDIAQHYMEIFDSKKSDPRVKISERTQSNSI